MKKNLLSYVAFLLSLVMLIGAFAACDGHEESTQDTTDVILSETESESASVSETGGTEQTEESETVTVTEVETETDSREPTSIENIENGLLIENAYSLANGVNACFKDEKRTEFFGENRQMKFEYALAGHADQQVTYLKNTKGNSYIENTFDVFVKMKNGDPVGHLSKKFFNIPCAVTVGMARIKAESHLRRVEFISNFDHLLQLID